MPRTYLKVVYKYESLNRQSVYSSYAIQLEGGSSVEIQA